MPESHRTNLQLIKYVSVWQVLYGHFCLVFSVSVNICGWSFVLSLSLVFYHLCCLSFPFMLRVHMAGTVTVLLCGHFCLVCVCPYLYSMSFILSLSRLCCLSFPSCCVLEFFDEWRILIDPIGSQVTSCNNKVSGSASI